MKLAIVKPILTNPNVIRTMIGSTAYRSYGVKGMPKMDSDGKNYYALK